MNQSPPMGRMLRRALGVLTPQPLCDEEKARIEKAFLEAKRKNRTPMLSLKNSTPDTPAEMRWIESGRTSFAIDVHGTIIVPFVIRRSLNTTGRAFRRRQFDWSWIKYFGPNTSNPTGPPTDFLNAPVTKKDILYGYLRAGHYFNNFKPRV